MHPNETKLNRASDIGAQIKKITAAGDVQNQVMQLDALASELEGFAVRKAAPDEPSLAVTDYKTRTGVETAGRTRDTKLPSDDNYKGLLHRKSPRT